VTGRLPVLTPDELTDEQAGLYDAIVGGPRSTGLQAFALTDADGGLNGPFNAMLFAPGVGHALQDLGAAIRYASGLSARVRELAILLVAARWGCDFERYAHEAVGRAVGLTDQELATVRDGRVPEGLGEQERAAIRFVQALLAGDVPDDEWAIAQRLLDNRTLVEMSTLVGYYATLALQLRVFRVASPPKRSG